MSTFELIIVALIAIYVFTSLYFSISGRRLTNEKERKEDERYKTQLNFEEQLKVLTKRMGEVMSENDRLNGVIRSWMAQANDYKIKLDVALKEKEEWQREAENLAQPVTTKKRNTKKGGE